MKNTTLLISILLTCTSSIGISQELHVFFNAHTKAVTYVYRGDTIYKPKVRKGEQIVFHLLNYNNFLFDAAVQGTGREIIVPAGSGAGGSLLGIPGAGAGTFLDLAKVKTFAAAGLEATDALEFGGSGFGGDAKEMNLLRQLKARYDSALNNMHRTERQINFIRQDVIAYREKQAVNNIILEELHHLKHNPRLQPEQIKSLSLEYLEKILRTGAEEDLTLSGLLVKANPKLELSDYLSKLETEAENYRINKNELGAVSTQLSLLESSDKDIDKWKIAAAEILARGSDVQQTITHNQEIIQRLIAEAQTGDIQRLAALRYEYQAIKSNDFSESFRIEADGDETLIKVRLLQKDDSANKNANDIIEMPDLKIPVFGGVKINTSVGVSFGQFFKTPRTYFVRDSLIRSQKLDHFSPIITSFLHFYFQSAGQISAGGSLGVGIPVLDGSGQQAVTFFLGPSLIVGKAERLVITAGLMGGKKQKLSNGYREGDAYLPDAGSVPTFSTYELGFALGFSFNLVSGN